MSTEQNAEERPRKMSPEEFTEGMMKVFDAIKFIRGIRKEAGMKPGDPFIAPGADPFNFSNMPGLDEMLFRNLKGMDGDAKGKLKGLLDPYVKKLNERHIDHGLDLSHDKARQEILDFIDGKGCDTWLFVGVGGTTEEHKHEGQSAMHEIMVFGRATHGSCGYIAVFEGINTFLEGFIKDHGSKDFTRFGSGIIETLATRLL